MLSASHLRAPAPVLAYAQCWEDADVLLEAIAPRPGERCLSIASAGDNTLALLARDPERVVALDCNPAQIASLELRIAAYQVLAHAEMLELLGSLPSRRRGALYRLCRAQLGPGARAFWDARPECIEQGFGAAGRLERYLAVFRTRVLPAIHSRSRIERLLGSGSRAEREAFYDREWNSRAWRGVFRIFFSRAVMGLAGRARSHFRYAEHSISAQLLERLRYACTVLDPAHNPYLHWILTGRHGAALPFALRAENFERIRANLDCLEWHCLRLESFLACARAASFDCCNLSDAFEYMDAAHYEATLRDLLDAARPGARLAYWNLLVARSRPAALAHRLAPRMARAARLHARDKTFFYRGFVLEEVQ